MASHTSRPATTRRTKAPKRRGLFVTFEGIEGSGKTTQIRLLARRMRRIGLTPLITREPGGTALGDSLRRVLLDPASEGMGPVTELLLYAAARADHVQRVIQPALERGRVVLCDRYLDATLAYQGHGRGLPIALIRRIHSTPPLTLRPDLTLLLDMPVGVGIERARARTSQRAAREARFEEESLAFHRRVAAGYRKLARAEKRRFRVIDATGFRTVVGDQIEAAILPRLRKLKKLREAG